MSSTVLVKNPETSKPLTKRQKQVLNVFRDLHRRMGRNPTVRELGEALGLSSPASVHRYLRLLERKGYVRLGSSPDRFYLVPGLRYEGSDANKVLLTSFEQQVVEFLTDRQKGGYANPTIREIAEGVDTSSISKTVEALRSLEKKGIIGIHKDNTPSISLLAPPENRNYLVSLQEVPSSGQTFLNTSNSRSAWLPLALFIHSFKETDAPDIFTARVLDDSMSGVGILKGDYVLCRKQDSAANGDIVVAKYELSEDEVAEYRELTKPKQPNKTRDKKPVERESVVLRLYSLAPKATRRISLEPADEKFDPIEVPANRVSILGVAVGLIRQQFTMDKTESDRRNHPWENNRPASPSRYGNDQREVAGGRFRD